MRRAILHVDMDEFFAAVEKHDRPELRGRPLLIGGRADTRGVVSTASYEARPFGCHSAMPMATAVRLCPQAIVLPVRGRRYREVSDAMFAILERFSPVLEPLSIDEAFLDVTGCERLFGSPRETARAIRRAIRDELGLTASVGVAYNKFLAKLASDLHKPDGLTEITPNTLRATLDPLPVERLWGVGPAAAQRILALGLHTVGQVHRADPHRVLRKLGSLGEHILALAAGEDDRPVTGDHEARSIGQEQTFAVDVADVRVLREVLLGQVQQVSRRLRRQGLYARTITLKLRSGDFVTRTRSTTLEHGTNLTDALWAAATELLSEWTRRRQTPLRLLGVMASNLSAEGAGQLSLLDWQDNERKRRLDNTLDEIADKFGGDVVRRGLGAGPTAGARGEGLEEDDPRRRSY